MTMLPENLYKLRREKGLSQEQLAEIIGVSRQTVSKWENGTSTPELEKLILLSGCFGIPVDELVKGPSNGAQPPQPKQDGLPRRLGIGLCILGAVCLTILGILMVLSPAAADQIAGSSAVTLDGRGLLMLLCVAVMGVGIFLVIRKND